MKVLPVIIDINFLVLEIKQGFFFIYLFSINVWYKYSINHMLYYHWMRKFRFCVHCLYKSGEQYGLATASVLSLNEAYLYSKE